MFGYIRTSKTARVKLLMNKLNVEKRDYEVSVGRDFKGINVVKLKSNEL